MTVTLDRRHADAPVGPALIRVVVADDSSAMRTLARYALSALRGFSVVGEAGDGRAAVDMVDAHHPDCVVLDIEMPHMGGFAALAELRERHPSLPVIMLSGYADDALAQQAKDAGAAVLLNKNSQLNQLPLAVQELAIAQAAASVTVAATAATASQTTPSPDAIRELEYVISHDLSEPLRIMSGFVSLLQSRCAPELDETGQAFVTEISSAAARMQAMIDDLLTYSRAGRAAAQAQPLDLADLVTGVYASLSDLIAERHVEATVGDLPDVLADAGMVGQIVRHLVVNAIRFNTSPTPQVRVSGHVDGADAVISVEDNGIGVEPANRERAFRLFQRLNTREEYAGNGAGLALCRRLLDLQAGQIQLDGQTGGGTVVTFTLPVPPTPQGDPS